MHRVLLSATVLVLVAGCDRAPTAPASPNSQPEFATSLGSLSFTNTPLLRPEFSSEPAISIAGNGTMAITSLQSSGTGLWTGAFGSAPPFRGIVDAALQQSGRVVLGGGTPTWTSARPARCT